MLHLILMCTPTRYRQGILVLCTFLSGSFSHLPSLLSSAPATAIATYQHFDRNNNVHINSTQPAVTMKQHQSGGAAYILV